MASSEIHYREVLVSPGNIVTVAYPPRVIDDARFERLRSICRMYMIIRRGGQVEYHGPTESLFLTMLDLQACTTARLVLLDAELPDLSREIENEFRHYESPRQLLESRQAQGDVSISAEHGDTTEGIGSSAAANSAIRPPSPPSPLNTPSGLTRPTRVPKFPIGTDPVCEMCALFPWLTFGPIPQDIPESASLTCRHGKDILTFLPPRAFERNVIEDSPEMETLASWPGPKYLIPGISLPRAKECQICSEQYDTCTPGNKAKTLPCCEELVCYCCAITSFSGFRVGVPIPSAGSCPYCRAQIMKEGDRIKDLDSLRRMANFMLCEDGPLKISGLGRQEWERVQEFLDKRQREEDDVLCLKGMYTSPDMVDQASAMVGGDEAKRLNEMMEETLCRWREGRYTRNRQEELRERESRGEICGD